VTPLIQLQSITKYYRGVRALDDVTLEVPPGVIGLLGPNGAGKSTLIKVLLGLVRISAGGGSVLGHKIGSEVMPIRASVGYLPEDDCYIAGLSGIEMVQFAARLSGLPAVEGLRRAHEIMDFCGIEQERYRDVETYPTGMRQKLKFAQAILHDPPLLILDEPTSGLDPEEREAMLSRVRILADEAGKSVIVSTHILPDVQAVCDRVIIMARGRIRTSESLEVLSRPASPTLELQVAGEAEPRCDSLRRRGLQAEVRGPGLLVLESRDADISERLWRWAAEEGVDIHRLTPARNSLEEIFIAAVQEESGADS